MIKVKELPHANCSRIKVKGEESRLQNGRGSTGKLEIERWRVPIEKYFSKKKSRSQVII